MGRARVWSQTRRQSPARGRHRDVPQRRQDGRESQGDPRGAQGGRGEAPSVYQDLHAALGADVRQSTLMQQTYKKLHGEIIGKLSTPEQAFFRSCGGTGAGSFLEGPETNEAIITDHLWATAVRFRLGCPAAAHDNPEAAPTTCCLRNSHGTLCGAALHRNDLHAMHCLTGGATCQRHGAVSRTVGTVLRNLTQVPPQLEQRIPELDRLDSAGNEQQAIMDVVHQHPKMGTLWLDISCVSAAAGTGHKQAAAARKNGTAAERASQMKKSRYGDRVIPVVFELSGRPAESTKQLIRTLLHSTDKEEAAADAPVRGARSGTSCTLQRYVALQLRRAAGL